jgi:hypothetical protein
VTCLLLLAIAGTALHERQTTLEISETRLRYLETLIRTIALARTVSAKWVCPLRRPDRACYVGFTFGESKPRAEETPRVWCWLLKVNNLARSRDAAVAIRAGCLVSLGKALSKMSGVPR